MHVVNEGKLQEALSAAGIELPESFNLDEGAVNKHEYALRESEPHGDKEDQRFRALVAACKDYAAQLVGLPSAADLDAVAEDESAKLANDVEPSAPSASDEAAGEQEPAPEPIHTAEGDQEADVQQ